jgi:hypothetical protein
MSGFDERERAIEAQFAHEQDMNFAIAARGNRLLARWASGQLRLPPQEAAAYETTVVCIALENGGEKSMVEKVANDLEAAGLVFTKAEVGRTMTQTMAEARTQILSEGLMPGEGSLSH